MKVRNHRIEEVWQKQTSNVSANRTIAPELIVLHFTTGWDFDGNLNWLLGRAGGTGNKSSSAHVVIDRDGTVRQICPFNRRAWHSGPSRWQQWSDINSHGIGIEFLNPGWLRPDGRGGWVDYHGHVRSTAQLDQYGGFIERKHPRVGSQTYAWPLYSPAQLQAGEAVCRALIAAYPIQAFVTHEQIDTRGWKTDPGPAMPLEAFHDMLLSEEGGAEAPLLQVDTTRLNLRGGPGTEFEKIDPPASLGWGTRVRLQRRDGAWVYVEVEVGATAAAAEAPLRGWVHGDYLMPVKNA